MIIVVSAHVTCCISKPGIEKGMVNKKKHLLHDISSQRTFLSYFVYEQGLQNQHGKCGRTRQMGPPHLTNTTNLPLQPKIRDNYLLNLLTPHPLTNP
jgi:hypothetical protein